MRGWEGTEEGSGGNKKGAKGRGPKSWFTPDVRNPKNTPIADLI